MEQTVDPGRKQIYFLAEICSIYGKVYLPVVATGKAARYATDMVVEDAVPEHVAGAAAWDATYAAEREAGLDVIYDAAGEEIVDVAADAAIKEAWDVAYGAAEKASRRGCSPQEIAEASCRVVIGLRKEIREKIFKRVEKLPPAGLKKIDETKVISLLLGFEGEQLESLKSTIPLQLCNYLFLTERIIRLSGSHISRDHLLEKHRHLVKCVELEEKYKNLFPTVVDVETHLAHHTMPGLPKVVIEIIVEYCKFCWHPDGSADEEKVFENLLGQ